MKTLTLTFTFLFVHMLMFTILSIIVSIFTSTFMNIITSGEWFFIYTIFFFWIPMAVCVEVHDKLEESGY
jgi:hypothetical protein